MKILLGILIGYIAIVLFFKLFGKAIARWAMRRLATKLQAQAAAQARQWEDYQRRTNPNHQYADEVRIAPDVSLEMNPKNQAAKPKPGNTAVQDVDYEDL